MDNIGNRIKTIMKEKGISQKELSKSIGISQSVISSYLNNKSFPTAPVIMKISKFFGITTDYLLFGDDQVTELIETKLIECFRELNTENQLKVVKEATGLREVQRLQESIGE